MYRFEAVVCCVKPWEGAATGSGSSGTAEESHKVSDDTIIMSIYSSVSQGTLQDLNCACLKIVSGDVMSRDPLTLLWMQDESTGEGENTDIVGLNVNWTGAEWLGSRYVGVGRCSGCVMLHGDAYGRVCAM